MLRIGWATRDMTPPRPAMVQGQMHRRIGRDAMDPLTVTAMAIEGTTPSDCAILVSCDMAYISDGMLGGVRERLARTCPEVPGDKLFMNATHTHTSMVVEDGFYPEPGGEVMSPKECESWVVDRVSEAAVEAWQRRVPRYIGRAFGHAVVGHNRYAVYRDGHAQMYGQTNREEYVGMGGYEDHSVDILFTWDKNGALAGAAVAIPCPSQVDEGMERFSADYWHEVRVELRQRFGPQFHTLGLCSAAGDQSPHFLVYGREEKEMRQRRGLTERQEIAQRVGDAVSRALLCTKPMPDPDAVLTHVVKRRDLTPYRIRREERDWAQAQYERCVQKGDATSWWPQSLLAVVEQHDGIRKAEPFPVEIHAVRIGDLAVVTSPFELFLDYGLRIKARSTASQTVVVQIVGRGWYLPTERACSGGGYGAMPAVCRVGPEGGAELVEETLGLIRGLFPPAPARS